jgi:hypothetical protein
MRIALCTLDEVNEQQARDLAGRFGDTLCPLWPKDGPPNGQFDAVIYDLDYWPADSRAKLLAELREDPQHGPVAVCSLNLDEAEIKPLAVRGAAVFMHLGPDVFQSLR